MVSFTYPMSLGLAPLKMVIAGISWWEIKSNMFSQLQAEITEPFTVVFAEPPPTNETPTDGPVKGPTNSPAQ